MATGLSVPLFHAAAASWRDVFAHHTGVRGYLVRPAYREFVYALMRECATGWSNPGGDAQTIGTHWCWHASILDSVFDCAVCKVNRRNRIAMSLDGPAAVRYVLHRLGIAQPRRLAGERVVPRLCDLAAAVDRALHTEQPADDAKRFPYVIVRLMNAVYQPHAVEIATAGEEGFISGCFRLVLPHYGFRAGRADAACRIRLAQMVAQKSQATRFRMCVVFGAGDAVYLDPDGSWTLNPLAPGGGMSVVAGVPIMRCDGEIATPMLHGNPGFRAGGAQTG